MSWFGLILGKISKLNCDGIIVWRMIVHSVFRNVERLG